MPDSHSSQSPSDDVARDLVDSILADERARHLSPTRLPDQDTVRELLDDLRALVFPGFFGTRNLTRDTLADHVRTTTSRVTQNLCQQIAASLRYVTDDNHGASRREMHRDCDEEAGCMTQRFLQSLTNVRRLLSLDVQAAYDGDPAAHHTDEAIVCYPGVRAIVVHRLAHELYRLDVPMLPRIMSEHAHAHTGIDIHPGATIGESFFIDHGTGVVIGETTEIGEHCKIYQGVTLGAKSFPKTPDGRIVRGIKRHPTLGDRVTVYASATILGGDTVIGDDVIVSGGVFLTRSVPAGTIVRSVPPQNTTRTNPESRDDDLDLHGV